MTNPSHRGLTPAQLADIERAREHIAAELPDLVARERRMREAAEENTFSGELRRAIHAGDRDLISLAELVGTTPIHLSEFLTGDRTLRSDVLDRLVSVLGARLVVAANSTSS
jgi:alkylhydroperoxidase/carboxymuconolactone decarboxylase family protein YurZ